MFNRSFKFIDNNSKNIITIKNTKNLEVNFYQYANNFYDAANSIMDYLLNQASPEHDIAKLDLWIYSLLYLYRHSLELILKAIVLKLNINTTLNYISHDVNCAFNLILQNTNINNNDNVKWLNAFLSDISNIDNGSDQFRYPINYKTNPLKNRYDLSLIDLKNNVNKAYYLLNELYTNNYIPNEKTSIYVPKLLINGGYYYTKSVINYKYFYFDFEPYYTSYEETAKYLYSLVNKYNNLFLPMCYLYINCIELALKRIIIDDLNINKNLSLNIAKNNKHNIKKLWTYIKDNLIKIMPKNINEINNIDNYISELHQINGDSTIFRYPCDKNKGIYFSKNTLKLDIDNVFDFFNNLCSFLDAVDSELKNIIDYENDK